MILTTGQSWALLAAGIVVILCVLALIHIRRIPQIEIEEVPHKHQYKLIGRRVTRRYRTSYGDSWDTVVLRFQCECGHKQEIPADRMFSSVLSDWVK